MPRSQRAPWVIQKPAAPAAAILQANCEVRDISKVNLVVDTATSARANGGAPEHADTGIYSTHTAGRCGLPGPRTTAHARIAEVLDRERERLLPAWIAALRNACAFYANIPDDKLEASLRPIIIGYRRYFAEGDPGPFLDAVGNGARIRFSQGFPLVAMEENVGAVRTVVLPILIQAVVGEPECLAEVIGAIMTIEEMAFVEIAEAYQERSLADLRAAQDQALNAERDKVAFCREMARLATRDKLVLCDHEDLPPRAGAVCLEISVPRDVRAARHAAAAEAASWPQDRAYSLQLCIGEAGTNALRHAGGATFEVWTEGEAISFRLSDAGPGIDFCRIPEALRSGFSTGSTLGMGFTLMLDLADKVYLATDHRGTTLQLTLKP